MVRRRTVGHNAPRLSCPDGCARTTSNTCPSRPPQSAASRQRAALCSSSNNSRRASRPACPEVAFRAESTPLKECGRSPRGPAASRVSTSQLEVGRSRATAAADEPDEAQQRDRARGGDIAPRVGGIHPGADRTIGVGEAVHDKCLPSNSDAQPAVEVDPIGADELEARVLIGLAAGEIAIAVRVFEPDQINGFWVGGVPAPPADARHVCEPSGILRHPLQCGDAGGVVNGRKGRGRSGIRDQPREVHAVLGDRHGVGRSLSDLSVDRSAGHDACVCGEGRRCSDQ